MSDLARWWPSSGRAIPRWCCETEKQVYHIPNGTLVKVFGERDDFSFVIVTDTYSDHRNRLVREGDEVKGFAKKYNFVAVPGDG